MTARRPDPDGEDERLGITKVRDLVLIAVIAGVALWILIRYNYGAFPSLPWPAGVFLYLLAAIEFATGFIVRARVAGRDIGRARGQLHPIAAARVMVLGKASAILGAIAAGGWAGVLVFLMTNGLLDAARADRPAAIVGAVGGVLLAAAALWLEHCCRAPDDPDGDRDASDAAPA
ncbi:DUF3180 domain-containing protein [Gordonia sp. HY285]|uniref:DUF3180 domain-containing protein n=1 Tax=Gordonia liuliyuniae TaxID=2911517 RepID=A0ABS9IPT9_9ACTN|nr:DUF3180 domain-containing protein [Gordonia liuliyuniae]MCF8587576.1 DUF3180 domain-containing protein [Gordonia liuliyuniae]MCF8608594.1 DUF3180 domain-containing protein [Gordonia liuliyuniae]